jgi:hypothetical protein
MKFLERENLRQVQAQNRPDVEVLFQDRYPGAGALPAALLGGMLAMNPSKRTTVEAALASPYLGSLHGEMDDGPAAAASRGTFSFNFEGAFPRHDQDPDQPPTQVRLRELVLEECSSGDDG